MIRTTSILTIIFFFVAQPLLGQKQQWTINPKVLNDTLDIHFFPNDPLTYSVEITDSKFDNQNYLWLASKANGLKKLDINHIVQYQRGQPSGANFDPAQALALNYFNDTLYVGTERGFLRFNPDSEKFHRFGTKDLTKLEAYKAEVGDMLFLTQDTLLISTKFGLLLFDKKKDRIIKTLWEEDPIKDGHSTYNQVKRITKDKKDDNIVWGVGRQGLMRLDTKDWTKKYFRPETRLQAGSIYCYMKDFVQVGNSFYIVYFGDMDQWSEAGNQILKYDLDKDQWKTILSSSRITPDLKKFFCPLHSLQLMDKYLMIGSRCNGLQFIDTDTDELIQFYGRNKFLSEQTIWKNPNRLIDFYLHDVFAASIDNDGYLWGVFKRDHIFKSIEPLFIPSTQSKMRKIRLNNLYVEGIKRDPFEHKDSINDNLYHFLPERRNVAFDFGVVNPSNHLTEYKFRINEGEWNLASEDRVVRIHALQPGANSIELKAFDSNRLIAEKKLNFYTQPEIHEYIWFWPLCISLVLGIAGLFYRQQIAKVRSEERLKSVFAQQIAEIEMEALRAQMNPHFLFNSLNSIKHYSVNKTKRETSQYITTFSRLIRQILQNSKEKIITLGQELEAIRLYVEVERNRFDHQFEFELTINEMINEDTFYIPPMLIQPYVENAIWHGIMHLDEKGKLEINISETIQHLHCIIRDNGVGREASQKIQKAKNKYKKKSLGTQITQDRIELIEKIYGVRAEINYNDKFDNFGNATGTEVILEIPKINIQRIESLKNKIT